MAGSTHNFLFFLFLISFSLVWINDNLLRFYFFLGSCLACCQSSWWIWSTDLCRAMGNPWDQSSWKVTFSLDNVGFATFGAPRPIEVCWPFIVFQFQLSLVFLILVLVVVSNGIRWRLEHSLFNFNCYWQMHLLGKEYKHQLCCRSRNNGSK